MYALVCKKFRAEKGLKKFQLSKEDSTELLHDLRKEETGKKTHPLSLYLSL